MELPTQKEPTPGVSSALLAVFENAKGSPVHEKANKPLEPFEFLPASSMQDLFASVGSTWHPTFSLLEEAPLGHSVLLNESKSAYTAPWLKPPEVLGPVVPKEPKLRFPKDSFDELKAADCEASDASTPLTRGLATPEKRPMMSPSMLRTPQRTPIRTPTRANVQKWTPPPAPSIQSERREINIEVDSALNASSLPLLSLALCRSHACSSRIACGKNTADHSLHEALEIQRIDAIAMLLDHGPKELLHEPCGGVRPLNRALKGNVHEGDANFEAAKLLLNRGADPNLGSGVLNDTPLHQAAGDGNLQATKMLLENGADPNATNREGQTPLHSLCCMSSRLLRCNQELVNIALLKQNADPNMIDRYGLRAVDYLNTEGDYLDGGFKFERESSVDRIKRHLQEAAEASTRTKLVLACGCNEYTSGFTHLPQSIRDGVASFL